MCLVLFQRMDNGTGGLGNLRTSGNYPNDIIIKICQNTEKSPGDLRRLAVTQTPVKDYQLMWKTLKNSNNNNDNRRHNWVGKLIHRELCQRLKPGHADKYHMHKPESVLENETHKILQGLDIKAHHPIPAPPRPNINQWEKNLSIERVCCFGRP